MSLRSIVGVRLVVALAFSAGVVGACDSPPEDAADPASTPFQAKCESLRPEGPVLDGYGATVRGTVLRFDDAQTGEDLCAPGEPGTCDGDHLSSNLDVALARMPTAGDVHEDVEATLLDGDCDCCTSLQSGTATVELTAVTDECVAGVVTLVDSFGFAADTFAFAAPRC